MGISGRRDPPPRRAGLQFDLNGRPVAPGRWETLRRAVIGDKGASRDVLTLADADVVVVAESDDEAASSSSVLDDSALRPDAQAIVRHVLALPAANVATAAEVAALDDYEMVSVDVVGDRFEIPTGLQAVVLARVQRVDALHLSQERSRMASLASRHFGLPLGWQIAQRPG